MRSLFLKIFLWFWVTVVAVGAALVITWSMQSEVVTSRWRASTSDAIKIYAQSAAEEVDRYGTAALNNYLQRLDSSAHIRAALLDDSGQTIAGRLNETGRSLGHQTRHGGQPEFQMGSSVMYAAHRAVGPSGRSYIFVAEMPRGPFGAFRPATITQLLRYALAVLISGLICYGLTRYLTAPILRLRTATRQLAAGNLSARAGSKIGERRDEIGDLVRDFNQMAERIEALLTSQRQLISDISHELRSPLARLSVALGLARQRAGSDAGSALDRIEREAERLNELIAELLTLARMESAQGPPAKVSVALEQMVRDVAADAGFEAQHRNCSVKLLAAETASVDGTPGLLHSAIENVVRNAVRYTAPGTPVEISLQRNCPMPGSCWAEVTVRDHGPGVPEAELAKIFEPFYRIAGARDRQTGGIGLGLAITGRAVRLHGGAVYAANAPGGGLLVKLRLPCAPPEAVAAEPAVRESALS